MPKNSPPERVRHLPDILLDALEKLSDGDWRRVTLGPDGDVVVHNRAQVFRVELEPQGTTAKELSERARHPRTRSTSRRHRAHSVPAVGRSHGLRTTLGSAPTLRRPSACDAPIQFSAAEGAVGASTN